MSELIELRGGRRAAVNALLAQWGELEQRQVELNADINEIVGELLPAGASLAEYEFVRDRKGAIEGVRLKEKPPSPVTPPTTSTNGEVPKEPQPLVEGGSNE